MKKTFYIIIFAFLLISCSSTKTTSNGTSKTSKKMLKGTWQVTNLRFVGEKGIYKANLFDIADSACFIGSEWVFIPNNGSGKFTINGTSNCEASVNRIHWSFYEPGDGSYQFQFKFVDEKNKPLDAANRGYRAKIDQIDENSMILRVATTYEDNPFDVLMTFNKVSDDISL
ncbi:MAG: hypothetical protein DSY82_00275 [Flavobacteriia bacterium]|nr:MAG: hypothetical protein DSY82_00275 [Flavobacteriia bacterium]